MQCNAIQYNTIQYNTIQYNTIQYKTIQYNTLRAVMIIVISCYSNTASNHFVLIDVDGLKRAAEHGWKLVRKCRR